MTTMVSEVYDAFKEAKVSDEAARKAAEVIAGYDDRIGLIGDRLGRLLTSVQIGTGILVLILLSQVALWAEMGKLEGHLTQIGSQISHIEQMLSVPRP